MITLTLIPNIGGFPIVEQKYVCQIKVLKIDKTVTFITRNIIVFIETLAVELWNNK